MNIIQRFIDWLKSLFGKKAASAPTAPGWNFMFCKNMPPVMVGNSFDFPQADGVHYVVKAAPPVHLGQKILMKFALEGNGELIAVDGDAFARVRIMLQKRGDNLATADARWWSEPAVLVSPGEYLLEAKVEFGQGWTSIGGGLPTAGAQGFNDCVANLGNIGFTFGGWSAGHGVYAAGPVKFILKSFAVN